MYNYLAIFVVSIIFPLFELLRLAQYSQELSQMMEIVVDKIWVGDLYAYKLDVSTGTCILSYSWNI